MRSLNFPAIRACCVFPAWRSRRGSVAVLVAITLVVLIGFVALGTEGVALMMTSRQMQSTADSAALAAATARTLGYPTAYANEAVAIAADGGYVNGVPATTTVAVNSPPVSGAYTGNAAAVQVVITQSRPTMLSGLSHNAAYTLTNRAVGLKGEPGGCVLALDGNAVGAILADNGYNIVLNNCGIAANSSSSSAIQLKGGADLSASWLNVVGDISLSNGATVNISGATRKGATAVANPYAARTIPPPTSTCNPYSCTTPGPATLAAGTYCSIGVSNNCNLTLSGGIYRIKDGSLNVSTGSITGNGVTIVLGTLGTGGAVGSVTISNSATVNLTAPTTGATAGMVFFQDIRAPSSGTNDFNGAGAVTLNGAVYFPNTTLQFRNGTSVGGACTQVIARMIYFAANTTLNGNCTGYGTLPIGGNPGRLVE